MPLPFTSVMMHNFQRLSACLVLLCFSGCAIHTPFKVVRYWADFNTERQLNAQVEVFDHLPPRTARVKLMRWGYNVGPECQSGTGTFGFGTGVWADRLMFWRRSEPGYGPADLPMDGSVPPLPPGALPLPGTPSPAALPPLPPPAPPAESPGSDPQPLDPLRGNLSAARSIERIATVGHQTAAEHESSRATNAAWMFTPPPRKP